MKSMLIAAATACVLLTGAPALAQEPPSAPAPDGRLLDNTAFSVMQDRFRAELEAVHAAGGPDMDAALDAVVARYQPFYDAKSDEWLAQRMVVVEQSPAADRERLTRAAQDFHRNMRSVPDGLRRSLVDNGVISPAPAPVRRN